VFASAPTAVSAGWHEFAMQVAPLMHCEILQLPDSQSLGSLPEIPHVAANIGAATPATNASVRSTITNRRTRFTGMTDM